MGTPAAVISFLAKIKAVNILIDGNFYLI